MRLVASGLSCHRGGRQVLNGLGFAVDGGHALVVTGPNGAGKSSLLRLLAGLLRPAEGQIRLEGADTGLSAAEQCHFLGHLDPAKGALTVLENLRFWADHLGGEAGSPAEEALRAAGLHELAELPASYLSAGQRRRLSLARLVAIRRPVWLLDEPTAALDTAGQAIFGALAKDHLSGGGILVAATHAPLGLAPATELRLGGGA
jgi:heme exporter protein A